MRQAEWLAEQVGEITDTIVNLSPSEWAEQTRRLPPSAQLPGLYDYAVTPYLREIVDTLDTRSPVRETIIMKGAQTGGTVGVAENAIGYYISQIKTAPMMLVTANQALASLRMEEYVTPMIEHSGLDHLIQANQENKRKSGNTARKMSWLGGGFLVPTSSNEAANLRSASIKVLLLDEVDAYPIRVGRDGDPVSLAKRRTASYGKSYKVLQISTPTTTEQSRIAKEYKRGDQRVFKVPCLGCGEFDEIKWRWANKKGEKIGGMTWALDDNGHVKPGSVMYACHRCGHCVTNEHKRDFLPLGRWEATGVPEHPSVRSYHITGLISPPDFYSWEQAVVDWLAAWDGEANKARDVEKLQEFYNNVLGETYRMAGARLTLAKVGRHARDYESGTIPNELAEKMCGGKVGFLTCAADVHKDFISCAVYAWGPNRVGFRIARHNFEGDTSDPYDESGPWGRLSALIDTKYPDGAGREYHITATVVDSGYMSSTVYSFCAQYESGVYPIKGDDSLKKGADREFTRLKEASKAGVDGWLVNVNHYKTRLSTVLGTHPRPETEPALVDSVSFPADIEDDELKELTAEEFVEEKRRNGKSVWTWKRVKKRNELWDLTVYNSAARDIVAYMICREHFELDAVDWTNFWPYANANQLGWREVTTSP
jgi:phage terminase large subunit GpA-like protein